MTFVIWRNCTSIVTLTSIKNWISCIYITQSYLKHIIIKAILQFQQQQPKDNQRGIQILQQRQPTQATSQRVCVNALNARNYGTKNIFL